MEGTLGLGVWLVKGCVGGSLRHLAEGRKIYGPDSLMHSSCKSQWRGISQRGINRDYFNGRMMTSIGFGLQAGILGMKYGSHPDGSLVGSWRSWLNSLGSLVQLK